jgi:hypothetical protein
MAKRAHTENGWLAFIPIANVYLMTQIGGVSGLWTIGLLAVFVPVIGAYAVGVLTVFLWWKVCEKLHRPGWWGILMLVPILNFVMMGVLAWAKK